MRSTRRAALLLVAGLSALAVSACGTDVPSEAELVEALRTSGVPAAEARCAADAILGTLSHEEVARIVERGPSGAPWDVSGRSDDSADEVRAALTRCREAATTSTTAETTGAGTSAPSSQTTTVLDSATTVSTTTEP